MRAEDRTGLEVTTAGSAHALFFTVGDELLGGRAPASSTPVRPPTTTIVNYMGAEAHAADIADVATGEL